MKKKSTWGGKRVPGPGKQLGQPLKGDAPRIRVNITIDPKVLDLMDKKRGNLSRGDFIAQLLSHPNSCQRNVKDL